MGVATRAGVCAGRWTSCSLVSSSKFCSSASGTVGTTGESSLEKFFEIRFTRFLPALAIEDRDVSAEAGRASAGVFSLRKNRFLKLLLAFNLNDDGCFGASRSDWVLFEVSRCLCTDPEAALDAAFGPASALATALTAARPSLSGGG